MDEYVKRYLNFAGTENPKYSGSIQYDISWVEFSKKTILSDLASAENIRETALYLSNYLACWGMYRGSSKIKDTNTYFLEDLVKLLLSRQEGLLIPILGKELGDFEDSDKPTIKKILDGMREYLREEGVSPTCTLLSKILLLLWGQIPAYDRYFKIGLPLLDEENICKTLNANSIIQVSNWFQRQQFNSYYTNSLAGGTIELPKGKVADMAIFQLGVENA